PRWADLAQGLRRGMGAGRRVAPNQHTSHAAGHCGENTTGERAVMRLCRKIFGPRFSRGDTSRARRRIGELLAQQDRTPPEKFQAGVLTDNRRFDKATGPPRPQNPDRDGTDRKTAKISIAKHHVRSGAPIAAEHRMHLRSHGRKRRSPITRQWRTNTVFEPEKPD